MPVYNIFIISRAGSLIYDYDNNSCGRTDVEKTFSYPLDFQFSIVDSRVTVIFGDRDGIRPGDVILAINGDAVSGVRTANGDDILSVLADPVNFPISARLGRPPLVTNEKIILASTFHSLHAIGVQVSPERQSSGIEILEADTFKLHCFQAVTGVKFVVVADSSQSNLEGFLRRLYELYADFALKNPFYSLDMPIRCELFDQNVQNILEKFDKTGIVSV